MDNVRKSFFKPYLVGIVGLGLGLGAFYGSFPGKRFGTNHSTLSHPSLSDLKTAPAFTLLNSQGKEVSLKDFTNSVVVVHFWAAWCPPCIPELPQVIAAAKKLPQDRNGKKIYWMLISQDETFEKAKTVLDEAALPDNVISVIDPEAKISDAFGTYQFPETYVLDRKHQITAKWIGPQEWEATWGEKAIEGIQQISSQ